MTGLHPAKMGAMSFDGGIVPSKAPTLAELATRAGYRTAAFTGAGMVDAGQGFARGFERYNGYPQEMTPSTIEDAITWIDSNKENRFFLFLHTYYVHAPYGPSKESVKRFIDPAYDGPVGVPFDLEDEEFLANMNAADRQQVRDLYVAQVRDVDAMLGRVFRTLKASGQWDNTLIAVFADHGEEFWEHGSCDHGVTLYDEMLHVPLIVKLSHQTDGSRISALVSLTDLFATMLPYLNVPPISDRDSRDLGPLMKDPSAQTRRDFVVSQVGFRDNPWERLPDFPVRSAIRTTSRKLILNPLDLPGELYDLDLDPGELENRMPPKDAAPPPLLGELESFLTRASKSRKHWTDEGATEELEDLQERLETLGYV
jgi:arylsulfatase A-like enzyme